MPNIQFEMAKLSKHWSRSNAVLDWVLIEQELTGPFWPIEASAQMVKWEENTPHPGALKNGLVGDA